MQYALLVYSPAGTLCETSDEETAAMYTDYETAHGAARVTHGIRLQDESSARTTRNENGQMLITDGPFAATKEVFGGILLVEAPNREAATEVAAQLQAARDGGSIEVRPLRG